MRVINDPSGRMPSFNKMYSLAKSKWKDNPNFLPDSRIIPFQVCLLILLYFFISYHLSFSNFLKFFFFTWFVVVSIYQNEEWRFVIKNLISISSAK